MAETAAFWSAFREELAGIQKAASASGHPLVSEAWRGAKHVASRYKEHLLGRPHSELLGSLSMEKLRGYWPSQLREMSDDQVRAMLRSGKANPDFHFGERGIRERKMPGNAHQVRPWQEPSDPELATKLRQIARARNLTRLARAGTAGAGLVAASPLLLPRKPSSGAYEGLQ